MCGLESWLNSDREMLKRKSSHLQRSLRSIFSPEKEMSDVGQMRKGEPNKDSRLTSALEEDDDNSQSERKIWV